MKALFNRMLFNRMFRAAKLDPALYEEVEADEGAFRQALLVVLISSVAAGVGSIDRGGLSGIFAGAVFAVSAWLVWSFFVFFIGTKLMPEPGTSSSYREILRTVGFASSPGLIKALGIIPGLASFVFFAASVWMIVAMVVGVRQALDYKSTFRAVVVSVLGFLGQALVLSTLLYALGKTA